MFEISDEKGLCDVIWGSEVKTSDLAAHFWRNSGAALYGFVNTVKLKNGFVYYSNVERTFKDGKIKSTVFTRPHAMKRHKIMSLMLRKRDS